MVNMFIPDDLAERLREFARRENRSVADVLKTMVEHYTPQIEPHPPTTQELAQQQEAVRRVRLTTYARARRYWQEMGNAERLSLTDEQLDEQFWLIDPNGIPRLKSEQGTIEIPPNPLLLMAQAADRLGLRSERDDISEHFDDLLHETWGNHLKRKLERDAD